MNIRVRKMPGTAEIFLENAEEFPVCKYYINFTTS
jgi:hypothetical protein